MLTSGGKISSAEEHGMKENREMHPSVGPGIGDNETFKTDQKVTK